MVLTIIASGCGADDDDDDGPASASPSETMPFTTDASEDSSGSETTTGEAQSCLDAMDAARAFIGANLSCEVDTDCTQVGTFCLPESTCGSSAIAVGYDMAQWMTISEGLNTCEMCGADPCGACTACTQGFCTLSIASCGE